jgi:hypothetical protein
LIDRRCPLGRRYHLDLAARFGVPTVQVCGSEQRGAWTIMDQPTAGHAPKEMEVLVGE